MKDSRGQQKGAGHGDTRKRPSDVKRTSTATYLPSGRGSVIIVIIAVLAAVILLRLAYIQIIKANEYAFDASEQRTRDIEIPARRGTVYDRNGSVLATTIDATTIYANPHEVSNPTIVAEQIATILGGDAAEYAEKLSRDDVSFVYIARKADKNLAQQIKNLNLAGIEFLDDSKRVYPYNEIGGQVIGFVGIDDQGLSGLELEYNDVLSGTNGELLVERGAGGIPIVDGVKRETKALDGEDIIISIDLELQQFVETTLNTYVTNSASESGGIVVYDGKTGEVYATASYPLLNPNNYRESNSDAFNLKTVINAFEPGSTLKAVTAAAVIDSGTVTADTVFDVPASLTVADHVVKDAFSHGQLYMTFREVIENSSNIGTVLAARTIGDEALYRYFKLFKFGEDCGVDFPGSSQGILANYKDWSLTQSANVPFGQGISLSPLQLARAYGAFANDGVLTTPHFLLSMPNSEEQSTWTTEQILPKEVTDSLTSILESVVTAGTANEAQVEGYTTAGKTGTAQRADNAGSYQADAYTVSFAGYLPNSGSDLVCIAYLENPASSPANAMFSDVMTFVAERYKLTPG